MVVYDVTERSSFDNVHHWLSEIDKYASPTVTTVLLIGNKTDLEDKRAVTAKEGQELADNFGLLLLVTRHNNCIGIHFLETSAKLPQKVDEAFITLAQQIMIKKHLAASPSRRPSTINPSVTKNKHVIPKGCCNS
jgi:Ras-related protein Rab-1A